MLWFTADPHFGHTSILDYCHRPFGSWENSIDVGVDSWDYEPVSLLRLEEHFLGV